MIEFLMVVFAALGVGLVPGAIAHAKGHDFFVFWIYGALLFLVATPHAILLTPNRHRLDLAKAREGYGHCPQCAELVRRQALKCPHCQSALVIND